MPVFLRGRGGVFETGLLIVFQGAKSTLSSFEASEFRQAKWGRVRQGIFLMERKSNLVVYNHYF